MSNPLVRYQTNGDTHFVTFSCYDRRSYLNTKSACSLFETSLERIRLRYEFHVFGYVIMPEHVHLLVTEPKQCLLSKAIQALKLSVAVQRSERPFWQARYYDFNVFTTPKHIQKLKYMHRNPVRRGLVAAAQQWPWSSLCHYRTGVKGTVEIESHWTAFKREHPEAYIPSPATASNPQEEQSMETHIRFQNGAKPDTHGFATPHISGIPETEPEGEVNDSLGTVTPADTMDTDPRQDPETKNKAAR